MRKTSEKQKRRPGRPAKPDAERRRDLPRLGIPLTAEEWALIDEAAAASGAPRVAWARDVLVRAAKR